MIDLIREQTKTMKEKSRRNAFAWMEDICLAISKVNTLTKNSSLTELRAKTETETVITSGETKLADGRVIKVSGLFGQSEEPIAVKITEID